MISGFTRAGRKAFNVVYLPLKAWLTAWAALLILTLIGSLIFMPLSYAVLVGLSHLGVVADPVEWTLNIMMVVLYASVLVVGYKVIDWPWEADAN